jgi:hypothetical protein
MTTGLRRLAPRSLALTLVILALIGRRTGRADTRPSADPPGGRYALVIGNSNYPGRDAISGKKDAQTMAAYLKQLGFAVDGPVYDASLGTMKQALTAFSARISQATVVVFFYSGHGFQLKQRNYLLPKDAAIDPDHPERALSVDDDVLPRLALATNAYKLIVLDACRNLADLPTGVSPGLAKPAGLPHHTFFAFAASYGATAESGAPDGYSRYSSALLHSLREPGLELRDLGTKVHTAVVADSQGRQTPREEGIDEIVPPFYFRSPVNVTAQFDNVQDDALLLLRGGVIMTYATNSSQPMPLQLIAGDNDLVVMAYHQRSFRNNQSWEKTEGWSYRMLLNGPDGQPLKDSSGKSISFEAQEPVPFKDGPHLGKVFAVASATVRVDPETAAVTLQYPQTDLWNRGIPSWAANQAVLYERTIQDYLDFLGGDTVATLAGFLDAATGLPISAFVQAAQFIGLGTLIGPGGLVDTTKIFVVVRGNSKLSVPARTCMEAEHQDRLSDFQACLAAARSGSRTPFDGFTTGLSACVSKQAGDPEARVWVALEDRSHDP